MAVEIKRREPSVIIFDEYDTRWSIEPDDSLYYEALEESLSKPKVIWPVAKLTAARGWGWWSCFLRLDGLEAKLRTVMPDPATIPLGTHEQSPTELDELLKTYGGYVAYLSGLIGRLRAEYTALNESYKGAVAVASSRIKATSEKQKEASVLEASETLRQAKRLAIETDSMIELTKGWLDAYDILHQTVSRSITIHVTDVSLQTGRRL